MVIRRYRRKRRSIGVFRDEPANPEPRVVNGTNIARIVDPARSSLRVELGEDMRKYYDEITGTYRFKRRYVWATWGLMIGVLAGWVAAKLI